MTFDEFMKKVDKKIQTVSGLGVHDFGDALWRDLYEDTENGEEATDEQIYETLADADDIFAQMLEVQGIQL